MFKSKVKDIISIVNNLSEEDKPKFVKEGKISISLDGKELELLIDWFDVKTENVVEGRNVEVLETGNTVILVEP